jgi:hypothetical protein
MTDYIEDRRGEAEDREMTCTYTSPPAAKRLPSGKKVQIFLSRPRRIKEKNPPRL